ncbi:glycoside hydrolase family 53 protein [Sediminitomix flava]|uniref:Arabinogalactan endo-beta-1,4-galactanase n=1 Tax=Sediminitomix flava TaxID=379075 RepID=A0A315Z8M4_SEDFL|nr:glycosyl hydrolase 53 family protein [Sediminitomix flava]PWJ39376.1 arabinogalactan endo-1,4-beta-galactosidase [Sediminitomix flava]
MRIFKFLITLSIGFLLCCQSSTDLDSTSPTPPPVQAKHMLGVDLSFLPEIEAEGTTFFDAENTPQQADEILKNEGYNTVRLRLWNNPENGHCNLDEVKTFSNRLKSLGYKVWLDFHYSDSWADPAKQNKPKAWEELSLAALKDSIYSFTTIALNEVRPDYVQIGNEINHGMLWPEGNISDQAQFTDLLKEGIKASRDYDKELPIILHFAGIEGADWFFGILKSFNVDYDLIGLSYYPKWHGKDLTDLENKITSLQSTHQKKVLIAETAYPFTLGWNDWTNNIIGDESQLISDFPASPEGQKAFLKEIDNIILRTDAFGWCYWAPDWVAFRGNEATNGSSWENQALFDFNFQYLH